METAWAVWDIFPLGGGCWRMYPNVEAREAVVQQHSRTGRDMPFLMENSLLVLIAGWEITTKQSHARGISALMLLV